MIHVVDTHALLRYLGDFETLGTEARQILTAPASQLILPTIVLAEAFFMIAKQKSDLEWEEITGAIDADSRFAVHPLTVEIIGLAPTSLEMHDAIICATALLLKDSLDEEVRIITRDREIRTSGLVETVW